MTRLLRCSKGHQWPDTFASEETTAQLSTSCPVCGSAVVGDAHDPALNVATHEITLGGDSNASSGAGAATARVEQDANPSDRTAPTIAGLKVDVDTTIMPDQLPAGPDQTGSTLALAHEHQPPLDRTESEEDGMDEWERTKVKDVSDRTEGEDDSDRTEAEDDSDHTAADEELERTVATAEAADDARTQPDDEMPRDQVSDQTQATAIGRPTDLPQRKGSQTGKRVPLGATRVRKIRPGKEAKLPEKIAGYDILGELGRGGMGVVYKARQAGLNRVCALKMILGGGMASADAIARFKIEAEAIAHLQHPNVVQVYETGEVDGCPYFSLEYVDGTNLQVKIGATPQPAPATARLMQQVCAGVQAAHQRGILHRDLKPANILMTRDNVPKITDFGLAKRLEEKDVGQTRSGAILGTPSYMAPEQAMGRAKEVGPAADIYSLGAVLYDMITGRPPFKGETVMDTLNQVQKLEPLPPTRLAPNVPLDLQTICLKALQKDPKKRYETAGEMGEDLRRFMAGEPILARPTPHWERAVKWVKRRPAMATLIGVSTLMVFVVLTLGGLWLDSRRVAAEDRANLINESNKALGLQLNETEGALLIANRAEEVLLKRIGALRLRNEPGMELVRRDLLESALAFSLRILKARNATDSRTLFQTALLYQWVGNIYRELGRYESASLPYQLALVRYSDLLEEYPDKEHYLQGQASCTMERAYLWQLESRWQESEREYRQAIALFTDLAKRFPNNLEHEEELANLYDNLATLCVAQGRLQEAEANFNTALGFRTGVIAKGQNNAESQSRLAQLQRNRATLLMKVNKEGEAEKSLLAARDVFAALSKASPEVPDYASELAVSWKQLAFCYQETKRPKLAADALRAAADLLEGLRAKFPNTLNYSSELGRVFYEQGLLSGQEGQLEAARDKLTKAADIQAMVVREQPTLTAVQFELARSCIRLGIAQVQLNNFEEGRKQYRKGVDLLEALHPNAGTDPTICAELATGHQNLAFLLSALNETAEADKSWGRLLSLRQELVKANPESRDYREKLAETHGIFADRFQKNGKDAEAANHWKLCALQLGDCMALATKETLLSAEARKKLLDDYGNNAIGALQRAAMLGFKDADFLKTAPEFRLLREWPAFLQLVNQMQEKAGKDEVQINRHRRRVGLTALVPTLFLRSVHCGLGDPLSACRGIFGEISSAGLLASRGDISLICGSVFSSSTRIAGLA